MAIKLASITFQHAPRIPGLRSGDIVTIECENPSGSMRGWRALLRGPSLFLVSPPGWNPRDQDRVGKFGDPTLIHEVPRATCYFHWIGEDKDVEKVAKFDSPPFGVPGVVVERATVVGAVDDDVPVTTVSAAMPPGGKSILAQAAALQGDR
jgi:hypothetical protein